MEKGKTRMVYVGCIHDSEVNQYVPECASFNKEKVVDYVKKKSKEWLCDEVPWLD